jgi:hypothetical protein
MNNYEVSMSSATRRFASVAATIAAMVILQPAAVRITALATLEVVASGLVNPRGLNFGPEGGLYVAEAGSGGASPCIVNSNSQLVCYGATGAVTRIDLGGTPSQTRIVTGLPSLAGGTGASATGAHDVDFQGRGNGFVTIGAALDPARRFVDGVHPEFAAVGAQFGRLVRFQPNGKWSFEEDLSAFELLANPDGNAFDSNPYGILAQPGRQVFTDAGGNSLNAVAANGSISNLAAFPNRLVPFAGGQVPMQAVPTTVTAGPDGALYVGQLTGFPFPGGAANIYRVPADGGTPEIFASGFTKIIDIAFAADGSLYVLQISAASGPPPAGGPGSLIRVATDGTRTTIVAAGAGLVAPGGIAIDGSGSIYVTNHSVEPGGIGTVVHVIP